MAEEEGREIGERRAAEALSTALAVYAEICKVLPDEFDAFLRNVAAGYRTMLSPRVGERVN